MGRPLLPAHRHPRGRSRRAVTAVTLAAENTAFVVVFSVFLVALVVLSVITVTWAVRRDKAGWREWRRRQFERRSDGGPALPGGPQSNGQGPSEAGEGGTGPGAGGRDRPPRRGGAPGGGSR